MAVVVKDITTDFAKPQQQQEPVAVPDDLLGYYTRQIEWSRETFGPALRTNGVIDHIRKELREIEAQPHDLSEWVDVVILAMDGFWRHGGNAEDLFPALLAKQRKNIARTWPDWRTMSEDKAIEHDRSGETKPSPVVPAAWRNCKCSGRFDVPLAARGCKAVEVITPSGNVTANPDQIDWSKVSNWREASASSPCDEVKP